MAEHMLVRAVPFCAIVSEKWLTLLIRAVKGSGLISVFEMVVPVTDIFLIRTHILYHL